MKLKCLLINGSAQGSTGNSAKLLKIFEKRFAGAFECQTVHLVDENGKKTGSAVESLAWAEAFVFATGTYWDSWGWPLQRFLESITETEGSPLWLGKPAAVLVTMHSVGGKGVLSRLQGVLNTFGAVIPPQSGLVISAIGQIALEASGDPIVDDLWQVEDLSTIANNLKAAAASRTQYQSWPVDRANFRNPWLRETQN